MVDKIACLVKIVPDVENFTYDYKKNILVRENQKSIINPDDACAVAAALEMKRQAGCHVTVFTMGPRSAGKYLEDLLRRGVDSAVLITDPFYRGSDTYVTAKILSRALERENYKLVLTGTRSLDGDTAHIPSQVAEFLQMPVLTHVTKIGVPARDGAVDQTESQGTVGREIWAEVQEEEEKLEFLSELPAVLGICSESGYKLPFVRYDDRKKDVSDRLSVLSNQELGFDPGETGLEGSRTKVIRTYPKKMENREKKIVQNDEQGITYVYEYLKEKGFL